ncbi:phosphate ABC transporter permease PstA [Caenispirillum bisanense]|uniref:Phosphate transport system permease protein PstA n=1 Tax=Caenispirillum bisanense TaxID=414052 RepID=A0A286GK09_9PROT|nr:phosphate ABC transporter permease PstA [Caenispirillum bisanense]SOD95822.1 phosphate ABC transporter membrane protein 2, PhoT family [Caenispirillum bisanense]
MAPNTPNAYDPAAAVAAEGRTVNRNIAEIVNSGLAARYRAERRFKVYGVVAIGVALAMLATLFVTIFAQGWTAFTTTVIELPVTVEREMVANAQGEVTTDSLAYANFAVPMRKALEAQFPDVTGRSDKRDLYAILSDGATYRLQNMIRENPELVGREILLEAPVAADFDLLAKGQVDTSVPETERRLNDNQVAWFQTLQERDLVDSQFNTILFTNGDSRQPELAGIWGAVVGSFYTLLVTLALSFPIGVAAAVYLEEFAPKNKWTDLIEVNINNLAAVPSIVFGLLGLAVFLQVFGLPRSAPLVGGLVLTLMTLPTIIIASRAALKSVPPSIREAALGVGASKLQMITHHVLPLAMPGMLTGTIIGMAQALGETAPLLMIGMVAFVVDIPGGPMDPATVLPVQIFLWADSPERAFVARTSAAIMVLLAFLVVMNALAVILRKKFERRW